MSGTFDGVGSLQFTPDNKYAYAYSGEIGIDSTAGGTTLLEFNTNSEYLNSQIQMFNTSGSGDDIRYEILFNNIIVASMYANSGNDFLLDTPILLLIPPFTEVKIKGLNISSGTARIHTTTLWGEAKGAIEQIDLEAITDGSKWAADQ